MKISIEFSKKELDLIYVALAFGIIHAENNSGMDILQSKIYALRSIQEIK